MEGKKEPLVRLEHVSKSYGDTVILTDINLTMNKNEITAIIGPSGTGKSTMLRCINYLTEPTSGKVSIADVTVDAEHHTERDVRELRKHSAMVFQNYNLFKNYTALDNVMKPLMIVQKMSKKDAHEKTLKYLRLVGMEDRADYYPSKLSGGQQQRVGIARALAVEPNILLLDEPTSALDPQLVGEVLNTIKTLADMGISMILVTHEIHFAHEVADRVIFMDRGKIAADGTPREIIDDSTDPRLREFLSFVTR